MSNNSKGKHKTLLGIDFGTKRIGLAIGQSITGSARSLDIIPAKNGVPQWHQLTKVIKEWAVDAIVVGLPLNMSGEWQNTSQLAMDFIEELKKHTDLPIYTVDERMTTIEAKAQISQQGRHKLDKARVDSYAAKLILEDWLTENKNS